MREILNESPAEKTAGKSKQMKNPMSVNEEKKCGS